MNYSYPKSPARSNTVDDQLDCKLNSMYSAKFKERELL